MYVTRSQSSWIARAFRYTKLPRRRVTLFVPCIRSRAQLMTQILRPTKGDLLQTPGLPPMYDYELQPQKVCRYIATWQLFS